VRLRFTLGLLVGLSAKRITKEVMMNFHDVLERELGRETIS